MNRYKIKIQYDGSNFSGFQSQKDKSGIQNKIDPGDAMDQDLYELPASELASIPTVCGSLREALDALSNDMSFLTKGGVFTEDQIEAYIDLKMEEVVQFEHAPHPIEFKMYYSS